MGSSSGELEFKIQTSTNESGELIANIELANPVDQSQVSKRTLTISANQSLDDFKQNIRELRNGFNSDLETYGLQGSLNKPSKYAIGSIIKNTLTRVGSFFGISNASASVTKDHATPNGQFIVGCFLYLLGIATFSIAAGKYGVRWLQAIENPALMKAADTRWANIAKNRTYAVGGLLLGLVVFATGWYMFEGYKLFEILEE